MLIGFTGLIKLFQSFFLVAGLQLSGKTILMMVPDKESLLHQVRFILYDAGTPLSPYEIAYRLLTTKMQSSGSVELLRQQVCRVVAASPLHLLQHRGLIRIASWSDSMKQTVVTVQRAYTAALTPDQEDLPEWYQPVLLSLLCY
ncbi:hypothetical protein [Pontibacter chinhatensis]|uniref:hypothetical protein n=1 Tax=Pontibacter chinhatensis TaxID=1436961 RepID=UPI000B831F76|nr:hypothetical protein [Pontibacter chinhatensis]